MPDVYGGDDDIGGRHSQIERLGRDEHVPVQLLGVRWQRDQIARPRPERGSQAKRALSVRAR